MSELKFHKGDIVIFNDICVPTRQRSYRYYIKMSASHHIGMLIGKTVCYEGKIESGGWEEPSTFHPEKSITFWLVEPYYNKTDRYLKPFLVAEEDLTHAPTN